MAGPGVGVGSAGVAVADGATVAPVVGEVDVVDSVCVAAIWVGWAVAAGIGPGVGVPLAGLHEASTVASSAPISQCQTLTLLMLPLSRLCCTVAPR